MASDRKPQDADKYILRFPDGMRDRLKAEAESNNRTLNAEIVARLQASFEPPSPVNERERDSLGAALEIYLVVARFFASELRLFDGGERSKKALESVRKLGDSLGKIMDTYDLGRAAGRDGQAGKKPSETP